MKENKYIDLLIKWANEHKNIIADFDITEQEIYDHIVNINKIYKIHQDCNSLNHIDGCNSTGFHFILRKTENYIYLDSFICPKQINNAHYLLTNNYWYSNINNQHQLLNKNDILYDQNEQNKIKLINLLIKLKKTNNLSINGIYLFGKNNIGKSFLITAFCNEMALQNHSIIYLILSSFLLDLKKSINNDKEFIEQMIDKLIDVDILVIDELDHETYSNFLHNKILYPVLNARNTKDKLTIFIANNSIDKLNKIYKQTNKTNSEQFINRIERIIKTNIFDLNLHKH